MTGSRINKQAGFGLIELMIALVLGLVVSGAAMAIFLSNQKVFRTTEAVGRIQEDARVAFELMARDIREAGGNPCGAAMDNMIDITGSGASLLQMWRSGVTGEDDSFELHSAMSRDVQINPSETNLQAAVVSVTSNKHGLEVGDLAMVCDPARSTVFKVTHCAEDGIKVGHNSGGGGGNNSGCEVSSGSEEEASGNGNGSTNNLDKCLDGEDNGHCKYLYGCSNGEAANNKGCQNGYWPASLVKLSTIRWEVADSDVQSGRKALFRNDDEIALGVTGMAVEYLEANETDYSNVSQVGDWTQVISMRITLSLESEKAVGVDADGKAIALDRTLQHTASLRSMVARYE